jgi:hypothetical protein
MERRMKRKIGIKGVEDRCEEEDRDEDEEEDRGEGSEGAGWTDRERVEYSGVEVRTRSVHG